MPELPVGSGRNLNAGVAQAKHRAGHIFECGKEELATTLSPSGKKA